MTRARRPAAARAGVGRRRAQEGSFLTEEQAPAAVFPDADHFDRHDVESTPALRERMTAGLDGSQPSLWEERYVVFDGARGGDRARPRAGRRGDRQAPADHLRRRRAPGSAACNDVAVMAYREAYGGEVRSTRFLRQYRGKAPGDAAAQRRRHHEHRGRHAVRRGGEPRRAQGTGPGGRPRSGRRRGRGRIGRSVAGDGRRWLAALVLLPCAARAAPQTQVHYVMGTYLRITADGGGAAAGMAACFQEARRLDDVFSRWSATSELSRLNATAPGRSAR